MKEHADFVMGHELVFWERSRAWNSSQFSGLRDQVPPVLSQAGPSVGSFGAQAKLNHQLFCVKQSFPHVQDADFTKKMHSFTFILAQLSSGSEQVINLSITHVVIFRTLER